MDASQGFAIGVLVTNAIWLIIGSLVRRNH